MKFAKLIQNEIILELLVELGQFWNTDKTYKFLDTTWFGLKVK